MQEKIDKLEALKEKLRKKLPEFLREYSIDVHSVLNGEKSHFHCINPEHNDVNTPNCRFSDLSNPVRFKCYAEDCGVHGDIFTAAKLLEGKPLSGRAFITDNVYWLADHLGVDYDRDVHLTDDEIEELDRKKMFGKAAKILVEHGTTKHGESRGWSHELCNELGIGTISMNRFNKKFFMETCITNYKSQDLNSNLFGANKLTFCLRDIHGSVIAFASRDLRHKPGSAFPKYINSNSSVYNKKEYLYGMHIAKNHNDEPLYIFEGYADVVTAFQHGIKNAVCVSGTGIHEAQLKQIEQAGFRCIRLCLDGDKAGKNGTVKHIKNASSIISEITIQVVEIPEGESKENSDPDAFIKEKGKDEFLNLPAQKSFDWLLNHLQKDLEPEEIVTKMVPFVARNLRPSAWNHDIQVLSEKTGIMQDLILREVVNYADQKEATITAKKTNVVQNAYQNIMRNNEDPSMVLTNAIEQLRGIDKQNSSDLINPEIHVEEVQHMFNTWDEKDPAHPLDGWDTGFSILNETLDGLPKSHGYIGLAGAPSMGKTTFFANIIWNLVTNHSNENISVVVFTIDDSRIQFIPRLLGIDSGIPSKHIKFPKKYIKEPNDIVKINTSKDKLLRMIDNHRLYIFDSSMCSMYSQMIEHIRNIKARDRSKRIIVFLDNLHKLSDVIGDNERQKFKTLSGRIKNDVVSEDFTMVSTLELRKTMDGLRPVLRDIMETGAIEYDCTSIILGYNEVHELRERADYYWIKNDAQHRKLPVFEANVAKNKHTGEEKVIYYEMDPFTGIMKESTESRIMRNATQYREIRNPS